MVGNGTGLMDHRAEKRADLIQIMGLIREEDRFNIDYRANQRRQV